MKKEELKKHIEGLPYNEGILVDTIKISRNGLLKLVDQLDEPQKPVVPQYVADWYEENEDNFEINLFQFIESLEVAPCEEDNLIEFIGWLMDKDTKPFRTLVNMHQFGYIVEPELEKEKRYYVRFKGADENYNYLTFIYHFHAWVLGSIKQDKKFRLAHTREELEEDGFGEVFDSSLFEIEVVE